MKGHVADSDEEDGNLARRKSLGILLLCGCLAKLRFLKIFRSTRTKFLLNDLKHHLKLQLLNPRRRISAFVNTPIKLLCVCVCVWCILCVCVVHINRS